jgi:D-arabinose 1-dehydrogenase-like Zn-dependent alcohol dehydrogenase
VPLLHPHHPHGQPLTDERRAFGDPEGAGVLVRILAAGVCHSDIMLHDGFVDAGGGRKVDMTRGIAAPRILGHEIAGEVAAVGPEVRDAKVGDRVVVYPWIGCGECAICRRGNRADVQPPPGARGQSRRRLCRTGVGAA